MVRFVKESRAISPVNTIQGLLLGLCMFSLANLAYASGETVHWSYSGIDGPQNWGSLASDYSLCASGRNQSPIDIRRTTLSNLFELDFSYGSVEPVDKSV